MPAFFTYILIIAVVLYIIISQFFEQQVKPLMLLGLPVAVGYFSYIALQKNLAETLVNPGLLIAALGIGLLPGLCLGVYRGTLVRIRRDAATGTVYARMGALGIVIWITLLVLRIAAIAVTYSSLGHSLPVAVLATTVMSGLFLGSIVAEKGSIFWRWIQLDTKGMRTLMN